jgi:hypothetical protein
MKSFLEKTYSSSAKLNAKLSEFESRYKISTKDMILAFKDGKIEDTAETAEWLVLAQAAGLRD